MGASEGGRPEQIQILEQKKKRGDALHELPLSKGFRREFEREQWRAKNYAQKRRQEVFSIYFSWIDKSATVIHVNGKCCTQDINLLNGEASFS